MTTTMQFKEWQCEVVFGRYAVNNGLAIQLVGATGTDYEGLPIAKATLNPPNDQYVLRPQHVCIKNYSENAGMLRALMAAGIVSAPVETLTAGFVQIPVCRLLGEPGI